jgi:universal stress protein A
MYKHILFAADLTDETDFILDKVRGMRGFSGAKLSLVHVVEPMPGYSYAYLGIEDIEGQLIDEARDALNKLASQLNVGPSEIFIEVGPTKSKF